MLPYIFLFLVISFSPSQAQAPYQVAINQSLDESVLLVADALDRWPPTAALFVSINVAMGEAIGNLSAIYNYTSADAQLFRNASYSNGDCPVAPFTDFIANATLILEFLCCHVQKIRSPGLLLSLAQMNNAYFASAINMPDPTSMLLDYIRQISNIATVGFVGRACLDDITVIVPQAAVALSQSVEPPSGILLQTYKDLILNTATLFTCVDALSAVCHVNGTLNATTVPPPDLDFPDVGFDLVCGYPVLSAFETSRFATPCAPINLPPN